ncbi:MAG: glycosyltransferase family 4 protein [Candidatus Omnitrophica bacterium]|nr:glycosyltransferase family 4 protein [Candidatus Omnitrophota bacterium]
MKVLFIARWFPEGGNYSGIFIKEHALAVSKFCEVAVIYGERRKWQKERYWFSFSIEDGLRILRFTYREIPFFLFPPYPSYVNGVVLGFEKFLSEGFKPDIVHANEYRTGIPAYIIKKRYGIPYVLTEHSTHFAQKTIDKKRIKRAQVGMENAALVLPVSNSLKEDILSYGIKGIFKIVPNAVSDDFYYNPEMRNTSGIKKILCVAAMRPTKNIPNLINACKVIHSIRQDWSLNIIGEGWKMGEYKEMVHNFSLDEFIHFLGGKQKPEIAKMMQTSDFFVLPSNYETFGVVLIEALACGLPVVATRVGGVPEIINDTNGILVEPDNPEELAKAMLYMMDNSDRYDRQKISLDAKNKYSYDVIGEKLISIYEKIISYPRVPKG